MFARETSTEREMTVTTVLDADGTIRYQSAAFDRACGYRPEEVVGDDVSDYLHPDDRERVATLLRRGEDATPPFRYRIRHADGSWVWFRVTDLAESEADERLLVVADVDDAGRSKR